MIIILCTICIYCGLGAYNNHKSSGKAGFDALPHIDTIRSTGAKLWKMLSGVRNIVGPLCTQLYHESMALCDFVGVLVREAMGIPAISGNVTMALLLWLYFYLYLYLYLYL